MKRWAWGLAILSGLGLVIAGLAWTQDESFASLTAVPTALLSLGAVLLAARGEGGSTAYAVALGLHGVALVLLGANAEAIYQDHGHMLLSGCSSSSVLARLEGPGRAGAFALAAVGWGAALGLVRGSGWRLILAAGLGVVAVGTWWTNYRAHIYSLCGPLLVVDAPLGIGVPLWTVPLDPTGPVDPTDPDLPVSVRVGHVACTWTDGGALNVYRIGAEPVVFTAPWFRRWTPYVDGVASDYGGTRTVWVCGRGAPLTVGEALAHEFARTEQRRLLSVAVVPGEATSTRFEARWAQ